MFSIVRKIKILTSPQLSSLVKKSEETMARYKKENVFQSNTMKELLSDKFEYKGKTENTVLVKDFFTGEPVELKVIFSNRKFIKPEKNRVREDWTFVNTNGDIVGSKHYWIKRNIDNELTMDSGAMYSDFFDLLGVGIRLDQIQIERAKQLGITEIPRRSVPKATPYHAKMGFLPETGSLEQVKSLKHLKQVMAERAPLLSNGIPKEYFEPILKELNGDFYLDVNKTHANANLNYCKHLLKKYNQRRLENLEAFDTRLLLSGEEFEQWKGILEKHSILNKLNINPNKGAFFE